MTQTAQSHSFAWGSNMTTLSRQIGFRLFTGLSTLLTAALSLNQPNLAFPGVANLSDINVVLLALVVASLVALVDVIVNDLLPARFSFHLAAHWRDWLYLLIALLYGILIYITARADAVMAHSLHLALNGLSCMWIATMDVIYRYVRPRKAEK